MTRRARPCVRCLSRCPWKCARGSSAARSLSTAPAFAPSAWPARAESALPIASVTAPSATLCAPGRLTPFCASAWPRLSKFSTARALLQQVGRNLPPTITTRKIQMTLRELIEKRNRLLSEARQLMTGSADLTAEQRTRIDAMLTDANTLKTDIERLEACAESEERSMPTNRPPREGFESGAEDTRSQE